MERTVADIDRITPLEHAVRDVIEIDLLHRTLRDIPATTPESEAMSKDLKRLGFRFVGSTICYAMMQACGLVDDHVRGCFRAASVG